MDETLSTPPVPAPTPAPVVPATPVPPKVLTPEEKAAKRKATFKRLAIVGSVTYVLILGLIFLWAVLSYGQDFSIFNSIGLSQTTFSGFLWMVFNVLAGALVGVMMLLCLFEVAKSLLTKKEDIEKKKKASRMALFTGIGFFLFAVLWLVGIWFLGERLLPAESGPPITTDPEVTIGLTSPITISFDASGIPISTDTYSVLSYTWTFGDGDSGSGKTTSHTYTHKATGNGIYTVTLNVTYADRSSGAEFDYETTTTVSIENESTYASFVANPDSGEIPLTVTFDATSSFDPDGEIASYEWDFDGDGRFDDGTGDIVDYEFTQEGSYDVTLRVTDNNGNATTATQTIEAGSIGGLRAIITAPLSEGEAYYINEEYEFDGSLSQISTGAISKYTWDFGDGSVNVSTRNVTHEYSAAGTYDLTLTVLDKNGNSDETILEVKVIEEGEAPVAKITSDPSAVSGVISGSVPLEVSFDAGDSTDPEDDIVDYEWDFNNDGEVDETGDKITYTFEVMGTYETRLMTTDSVGNSDEATVTVNVGAQGVVATLDADISNGEVPLTVHFDASASSYKEGSIVSYEYDFGDGSDIYNGGSTVTYKYTDTGTFTVTLTVIGDDGEKGTDSMQVVVRPVALTACFTVNTDSGNAPLFVVVNPSCSSGTISDYRWDFGDGEKSFDHNPDTHSYATPGVYTIELEVTESSGIVDTFTKTITVN